MKIQVKVRPSSKQQKIEHLEDGSLMIYLKSSPTKGKANQELAKILAKQFQVTQSHIRIQHGLASKKKLIEIK
ncbi:DUF167 domain-containing protein [Pleurocapsales cyanobacterium LEGE 10410]|nr:DUF167 domain-containing protein [Pleurocapsales cyanobacterium LEGE 10410]